ncbi:MAG: DUF6159 family protein [Candidatus Thermoplasmatota archaeon]|nr:DUF6159 family protein [Candidatus Thermoplasmatota archaeon]
MAGTFRDSWNLTKTAFRVIREDKALLAFPAIAAAAYIAILVMFLGGIFALYVFQPLTGNLQLAVIAVLVIMMYVLLWFNGTYFTAALIGAAMLKLEGKQPTLADGLEIAAKHWKKLFVWAVISGIVGLAIQAISSRVRGLGGLILGIAAGATWTIATYFIIPVLIFEDQRAWPSLKRSASLYLNNFGRTFVSNLVLGLLVALPLIGAVILGIYGMFLLISGSFFLGIALIAVAIVIFAL